MKKFHVTILEDFDCYKKGDIIEFDEFTLFNFVLSLKQRSLFGKLLAKIKIYSIREIDISKLKF